MKSLDKFYTRQEIAEICVNFLLRTIEVNHETFFIEPAAGDGSFVRSLKSCNSQAHVVAIDLDPAASGILQADFLSLQAEDLQLPNRERVVVLGNPPFGRGFKHGYAQAIKFLNHSAELGDVMGFILPAAFAYDWQRTRVRPDLHLLDQINLPQKSFLPRVNIRCVFQVWQRREFSRQIQKHTLGDNEKQIFVRREMAKSAIVRAGFHAGRVRAISECLSESTHFFLSVDLTKRNGELLVQVPDLRHHRYVTKTEVLAALSLVNPSGI